MEAYQKVGDEEEMLTESLYKLKEKLAKINKKIRNVDPKKIYRKEAALKISDKDANDNGGMSNSDLSGVAIKRQKTEHFDVTKSENKILEPSLKKSKVSLEEKSNKNCEEKEKDEKSLNGKPELKQTSTDKKIIKRRICKLVEARSRISILQKKVEVVRFKLTHQRKILKQILDDHSNLYLLL